VQTAEAFESERQRRQIEDLGRRGGAMAWLHAAQYLVLKGIGSVSGIVILMVGGAAVAAGKVSLGALLAFYYAAALFHSQLGMIIAAIPDVIAGREALATLHGIATADDRSFYVGKRLIDFHGEVNLKGVSFGYDGPAVLQEVDLTLQPGTITGLIGANGSGKTTIAYLIMGFYRPQAGEIFADGRSYLELDIPALRRRIGMVMQDSMLMPGTIRENIAYGHPEANWRDVEKAAGLAMAQPFIAGLSHGYETMVGHEGELLSGGQRQRIVLARALLRHPALLILDEPGNHLDVDTVNAFFDNLKKMDPLPTVLIIGHDRRSVRLNGQILIARNGRVVSEAGAWEQGLKQAPAEEKRK
jgi:ABC-type bacteriocin/lantibiotic exporter with double-glycine peptidase domain